MVPSVRQDLRATLPAALIAACALLPFLGKTFTIDDTLFLREAEHALVDPLHPAAFSLVWFASPERLSVTLSNGPVMAYLLAPVVAAGASESLAHLESLLFFALGIWGTAACARRLGCGPRGSALAGLLLACTPVALAMATTSMPDIPAMTFGVWGVEQYWAWIAERRTRQAVLAALLFALAMLSRLHAAGLLLIALVGGLRGVEPRASACLRWIVARRSWLPLVAGLALAALVLVATRDPQSQHVGIVAAARRFLYPLGLARNGMAFGIHWVTCLPFGLAWIACARRRAWVILAFAFAVVGMALRTKLGHHAGAPALVLLAALGFATTTSVLVEAWLERDFAALVLGLWLFVALPVVLYLHLPAKYLLLSAPAAAILVARASARLSRLRVAWVAASAVAGLLLGVLINRADLRFGASAKRMALSTVGPAVAAGKRVWFAGHWGFQWYMEQAGARCLSTETRSQMAPGDLLVVDRLQYRSLQIEPARPLGRLLAVESETDPGGRIMQEGAGFYDNSNGLLPWVWGRGPAARVELWSLD
jgi:hypothetical protein